MTFWEKTHLEYFVSSLPIHFQSGFVSYISKGGHQWKPNETLLWDTVYFLKNTVFTLFTSEVLFL